MKIYVITNQVNGKTYIGLTKRSLETRFREHKQSARIGHVTYLYNAIRKYGPEEFTISLLEETDNGAEREKFYIEHYKPDYNMTKGGDGVVFREAHICITDGVREWYIRVDDKIPDGCRRGRLPAHAAKAAAANAGKKRSPESIERTAAKHRGMKRSTESRHKMSVAARSRPIPLETPAKRAAAEARRGIPRSEETKAKMRATIAAKRQAHLKNSC